MKSYENKPKDEHSASDGLVSADSVVSGGEHETLTTTDHVSANDDESLSTAVELHDEVDIPKDEGLQRRRFWPPTRAQLWTGIAFWGVILLGAILRFWGLGDKPLHHDESLHAYFSLVLLHNNVENWYTCAQNAAASCYRYDPLTHGPFQFHIIAFIYWISQILRAPDHGINTTTVRIAAATLGTVIVGLPFFLRDYIGKIGAWVACFLLAISPSMVYYSRFAREDIYMACFTLMLVVATARYMRSRNAWWLLLAAVSFTLSYATKEATFLTIGVFGSFLGALVAWEVGLHWSLPTAEQEATGWRRFLPKTAAPYTVLVYFIVIGIIAKILLDKLKQLAVFIAASKANQNLTDTYVSHLKTTTEAVIPWLGMALAVVVFVFLIREQFGHASSGLRGLARHVERKKQPVLDAILTMHWTHWFFALVVSWFVFIVLFTVLFTNVSGGIGDGIWQGLYYWVQQQQVARGGQPWYYYFLLIPLYEQIGVVFGIVGLIRCLVRPTRFHLFLVYWFIGNVFIYTWAGEKMPWLMIHMTMPMMILAAIALESVIQTVWQAIKARRGHVALAVEPLATSDAEVASPVEDEAPEAENETPEVAHTQDIQPVPVTISQPRRRRSYELGASIATIALALLLLIPTLQNMFQVTFVHYADAPHEMMIYVQTATDINTVMDKVAALDNSLYGGKHTIPLGITSDATWPFAWYVRDYTNVCFNYPDGCSATAQDYPVVIASGDAMTSMQYQKSQAYLFHQYHMRTQWDQGYMPPACQPSKSHPCTESQPYVGVGPWLWLSYGDNPPVGAKFDLGRAINNIWQWWWQRKAFGSTDGTYDMGLFIRTDKSIQTGIKP
ncbi:flippase activity-associated protein Agl23 [Dictyobacter arantiisoli]|uniref:Glycosyltransferase RgtA/B/C/D-like domain-containing protein n=1 Tax=Dictyobacter arantiisoli TaxID=2014874 RepID=A0A5A5TAS6_9CHLR|nr:flippase activity-associated protein Agl23 [Dictyobacter arantiisoli]GCF08266.1 hypothetical protein KDI_18300 [Dictyobacter arantiisoli]